MSNKDKIIFNSKSKNDKTKKEKDSFFNFMILSNIIIIGICIIVIFSSGSLGGVKPIYIVFFAIVVLIISIQVIFYKLIIFYTKRVYEIVFNGNQISIRFKKGTEEEQTTLNIHSSEIKLFELKDRRSSFIGLEMNIIDRDFNKKYVLTDRDWSYKAFEKIYLKFRQLKNEEVPKNEEVAFRQLQIMNNSYEKKNAG